MILPEGLCAGERGVRIERDVRREIAGERECWRERVLAKESVGERLYMPGEGCVMGEGVERNLIDGMVVCSRGE